LITIVNKKIKTAMIFKTILHLTVTTSVHGNELLALQLTTIIKRNSFNGISYWIEFCYSTVQIHIVN